MAGTQANLPPPNSDEWLAYSPEFVYKYHTARLSGRLLVYVSLGYGWLKMEEHHPQSGTRINVLHKLSNDIDRLCRDQGLNPKVFRESFDRGRSRNIAYKDGKRGDKLDKATVVHPTNILSAPTGLSENATLKELLQYDQETAPPDWYVKMASAIEALVDEPKGNRTETLRIAFGHTNEGSTRNKVDKIMRKAAAINSHPDLEDDDMALLRHTFHSSTFLKGLAEDTAFAIPAALKVSTRPPPAKISMEKIVRKHAVEFTETARQMSSRGTHNMVGGSEATSEIGESQPPAKRSKSSSASSESLGSVSDGTCTWNNSTVAGNVLMQPSVFVDRPASFPPKRDVPIPAPDVADPRGLAMHTKRDIDEFLGNGLSASVTSPSRDVAPSRQARAPSQAPAPQQLGDRVPRPAARVERTITNLRPTNRKNKENLAALVAPPPPRTRSKLVDGTSKEKMAALILDHIRHQLRTSKRVTLGDPLALLTIFGASDDMFEGLGETATTQSHFRNFCNTFRPSADGYDVDEFVAEVIWLFIYGPKTRGTFLEFLTHCLQNL